MNQSFRNSKLDDLVRQYAQGRSAPNNRFMHWVYLPAILFGLLGMLFALNFGIAMIAIGIAILYYSQYGKRVAAQLGFAFLVMLAVWLLLMPAHYLAPASLAIFVLALAGQLSGQIRAHGLKPSFAEWRQYLVAGPVYALMMIR